MVLNFGILSTANIARKVGRAISAADGCAVVAIASRDKAKCLAFAKEAREEGSFDVDEAHCFGSYQELLQDPLVDAVYIPLPTAMHREWVIACAQAGKHVLVEKPLAPSKEDAQAMFDACERAGVQLMDGVMFVHHERTPLLCDAIRAVRPQRVNSHFSFRMQDSDTNIRCSKALEPLGSLGDLGWYCARFSLMCFEMELPEKVFGSIRYSEGGSKLGVPWDTSAILFYADGRVASFDTSFGFEFANFADVFGPDGIIRVADFTLPFLREDASPRAADESVYHARSGWQFVAGRSLNKVEEVCSAFSPALVAFTFQSACSVGVLHITVQSGCSSQFKCHDQKKATRQCAAPLTFFLRACFEESAIALTDKFSLLSVN